MKRTELKRKTELKRGDKELKRTGFKDTVRKALPKRGRKSKSDENAIRASKPAVKLRAKDRCEFRVPGVCTQRPVHFHHRQPRRCNNHSPANLAFICDACHRYTHEHPALSLAAGRMVSSHDDPAAISVKAGRL